MSDKIRVRLWVSVGMEEKSKTIEIDEEDSDPDTLEEYAVDFRNEKADYGYEVLP